MKAGFLAAWPLVLGYFPVAVAFGLLGREADPSRPPSGSSWFPPVSAGARKPCGRFGPSLAHWTFYGGGPSAPLNLRHAFYGGPRFEALPAGRTPRGLRSLTDEALRASLALKTLPHLPEEERRAHFLGLGLGAYLLLRTWGPF
jgi:predicted branched-subunit amino acid permease